MRFLIIGRLDWTVEGCTGLTGNAPELWKMGTNNTENNYQGTPDGAGCFNNCTGLTNYNEIPDYWKSAR